MLRTPPWLASILEEHFEELGMLWELRQNAVFDPDYDIGDLRELDERIEAHTDGLVLGNGNSLPLLEAGLQSDEESAIFAATYVLLRLRDSSAAQLVVDALAGASEETPVAGICDAVCVGPIDLIANDLKLLLQSDNPLVAATAAKGLAFHRQLDPSDPSVVRLFNADDACVRRIAWDIVSLMGE